MNRAALVLVVFLFAAPAAAAGLININTATQAQLETLKGIGPTKAKAIIEYRTQHGPFARIEDIVEVSGIGPKTYEGIRAFITIETVVEKPVAAPVVHQAAAPVIQKNRAAPVAVQEIPVAEVVNSFAEVSESPKDEGSSQALWFSLGALAVLLGGTVGALRYIRPVPAPATFPTADEFEIEE